MTQLVIPFHQDYLQPETREFGARNYAKFHNVTDDPFAYWRLFADLWNAPIPERFILCEHDIVPTDTQLAELRDCPEPWCVFGYERLGSPLVFSLGFTAFDPAALPVLALDGQWSDERPDQGALEKRLAAAEVPSGRSNIAWNHVDGVIFTFLGARGYTPHRHVGTVRHLRERRAGE